MTSAKILSNLSNNPPWPGIILLLSLTQQYLLKPDSRKSPAWEIIENKNERYIIFEIFELLKKIIVQKKIGIMIPPINPDTVLLGLMLGIIFGPPIIEPQKYAETSTSIAKKTIKKIKSKNSILWLILFKKINARDTYNKQIIFITEIFDSLNMQTKIRIKQNICAPKNGKFNRKTKTLIK